MNLEAKTESKANWEPQASTTHSESFLAAGKYTPYTLTKTKVNRELNKPVEEHIDQFFEKCFHYQKPTISNTWCLPNPNELFQEHYQLENLQEMKLKLNQVKSKLNCYQIENWSKHTRRQDPAGGISWHLKTNIDTEFVTIAWCKLYECLGRYPELIKSSQFNSLHLCEAPGAFIAALNHFLYTTYDKNEVKWNWLATTLNPYYEGNTVNNMIMDDRFLLHTLENWLFHKDFTGNIIDRENLQHMQQECEKRLGQVHLITADGSVDCIESPDFQEEKVDLLHYAEITAALNILADGGSFIIKMFTMYEVSSVSKLYLLNCVFENVYVFKPVTSKRGNSEVYVVCLNYKKQTTNLQEILEKMLLQLDSKNTMQWPSFSKSVLLPDFLIQHENCCHKFMNLQIEAIEDNIFAYHIKQPRSESLQYLKTAVCEEFCKRYKICALPDELKILKKFEENEKSFKTQIYKGSYSERKMLKETVMEEKIIELRRQIKELKMEEGKIKTEFQVLENQVNMKANLTLYRGKGVVSLNSSIFADVRLIILSAKLKEIFSHNIDYNYVWLQNSRAEFNSGNSMVSIKFSDFATTCGNFCKQQGRFFKSLISKLVDFKPKQIKFVNMPFLTHYAVSILRFLSESVYLRLSFSLDYEFEIVLDTFNHNFIENLKELEKALCSDIDDDILCVLRIINLHRNDFNKTLCTFNNNLLLNNCNRFLS